MHMFYRVMKGIYQFAANLLSYIPAKFYWNRSTSDLVIAKSRRVNVFLKHSVYDLKSLAPINGLTRLLALASCDCLHCKIQFCCELSQRTITNWWRHGRQLKDVLKKYGRMLKRHVIVVNKAGADPGFTKWGGSVPSPPLPSSPSSPPLPSFSLPSPSFPSPPFPPPLQFLPLPPPSLPSPSP